MDYEREHLDIDREAEAHGYENAQPNFELQVVVDSSVKSADNVITTILEGVENGNLDAEVGYAIFDCIEKALKKAKDSIKKEAIDRVADLSIKSNSGFSFEFKNGSKKLQYKEDIVFSQLTEKLTDRSELLKVAQKSKEMIFDSGGVEVPKVSVKCDADSISIKINKSK